MRTQISVRRKAVFSIVLAVFVVVAIEIMCRLGEPLRPSPESIQNDHSTQFSYPPWTKHPYLIRFNQRNVRLRTVTTNSVGFRGKRELGHKTPNTRRVFVLGGSTAVGHSSSGDSATMPQCLERRLGEMYPGLDVKVHNAACSGFNSSQELILLALTILELEPDLVIVLDGRNDFYFSTLREWQPHYTIWSKNWGPSPWASHHTEATGTESARGLSLVTELWHVGLHHSAAARAARQLLRVAGEPNVPVRVKGAIRLEAVDVYIANVKKMAELCSANNTRLIVVLQPSICVSSKVLTSREREQLALVGTKRITYVEGFAEMMQSLYAKARGELPEVRLPNGTFMLDASDLFARCDGDMFADEVHFTDRGYEFAAEVIARFVEDRDLIK